MIDLTGVPKHRRTRSEMLASVWSKLTPGVNTYNHFSYLGRFPSSQMPKVVNCEAPMSASSAYFSDLNWFTEKQADLVVAKNAVDTLDISVRKMDMPVTRDYLQCPLYSRSLEVVLEKFRAALTQTSMSVDEVLDSIEMDKATGYILRQNGYKKKYEVILKGIHSDFFDVSLLQEKPIWLACGKEREFLYRQDYMGAKKQRTFIVEPFELLFQHKLIYGHQQEGMKNTWWSAYGFNPYEGGTTVLANRLNKHKRKTMFDVVRYDRLFPHMRDVFAIKNVCLPDSPFKQWVTDNCCDSYVVLPSGDLVFKTWGNNSGSGSTTVDNIIGMAICLVHFLLRLGVSEQQIDALVEACLFGDDVVLTDDVDVPDSVWKSELIATFALYGFKFDPLVVSNNLEDMSFLGFSFSSHGNMWFPKYDLGTLAFGFTHNHNTMDRYAEISKMCSLLLMSAGHGEDIFNKFREELINSLINCDDKRLSFLKVNQFAGVPTYVQTIQWYSGYESSNIAQFLFF
jgi:hypothetical protein